MRLLSLKKYLQEQLVTLSPNVNAVKGDSGFYYIRNWQSINKALISLSHVDFFYELTYKVLEYGSHYDPTKNHLLLDNSLYNEFCRKYQLLLSGMRTCYAMIDSIMQDDEENQLNIIIPTDKSLEEIEKIFNDLNFIFNNCNIIKNANEGEEVQISKIDSGSVVVALSVAGGVVGLIGGIIKLCYDVQLKRLEKKKFEKQIEVLETEQKLRETILESYQKYINEENHRLADNFVQANKIEATNEDITALGLGMGKIINLIEKNVFIVPSLEAPEEIKKLFPKQEEIPKLPYEPVLLKNPQKPPEQPKNEEETNDPQII